MNEELNPRKYKGMTAIERINLKLELNNNGCLEWTGYKNKYGYGRCRLDGNKTLVHRYVYAHLNGEIPENMIVCHRCDNPSCSNIDHLFLGTLKDNASDMSKKGRQWLQRAKKQGLKFSLNKKEAPIGYEKI